ncbi:MAG: hypothetical protein ACOCWO_03320, partial [Candidatus Muiribacteriaceae bacterium]
MSIRMKSILERFSAYILIFILMIINLFLISDVTNKKNAAKEMNRTISEQKKQEEQLVQKRKELETKVEEKSMEQKVTDKNIVLFKNYFITRDDIPLIMKDVQKIGDEAGVDIFSFDYKPLMEDDL